VLEATIRDALAGGDSGGDGPVEASPRVIERPGETHTLLFDGSDPDPQPAVQVTEDIEPGSGGTESADGQVATLTAAGSLPLTGAGVAGLVWLGLSLLSSGAALRRIP
jgi:LPXTG-motif cell wall-anchored protein